MDSDSTTTPAARRRPPQPRPVDRGRARAVRRAAARPSPGRPWPRPRASGPGPRIATSRRRRRSSRRPIGRRSAASSATRRPSSCATTRPPRRWPRGCTAASTTWPPSAGSPTRCGTRSASGADVHARVARGDRGRPRPAARRGPGRQAPSATDIDARDLAAALGGIYLVADPARAHRVLAVFISGLRQRAAIDRPAKGSDPVSEAGRGRRGGRSRRSVRRRP